MDELALSYMVDQGCSTYAIAQEFNMSQSNVRYWLNKYGLKTFSRPGPKPVKTENYCAYCSSPIPIRNAYCNMLCKANYDAVEFGKLWESGGDSVLPDGYRKRGLLAGKARRYIFIRDNFRCVLCGWTHNYDDGALPPLQCSHIDRNYKNNHPSNIRLLCPNCHAIYDKNYPVTKGDGRRSNGVS